MTKDKLIETIEKMICDRNYYINSTKSNNAENEKRIYAWEYSRAELQQVLKLIQTLDSNATTTNNI